VYTQMLMIFSKMEPYWASFMIFASLAIPFVALSCPTQSSTKGNSTTMMTQVDAEAQLMDSIKKACVSLYKQSGNPKTVWEEAKVFAQQFGKLKPSEFKDGYYVEPVNKLLKEVIVHVGETGFYLSLYPSPSTGLSIRSFEKVFGAYEEAPRQHWEDPERIIFYLKPSEITSPSEMTSPSEITSNDDICALRIDYRRGKQGIEDAEIVEIGL
jgi:hypothetical protein